MVRTRISPGNPTSAGISKDSKERMKINRITEKNAGSMSRSETRRKVCQSRAPQAADASSSDGSMERKEAASIRNTNGDQRKDSTRSFPTGNKHSAPARFD